MNYCQNIWKAGIFIISIVIIIFIIMLVTTQPNISSNNSPKCSEHENECLQYDCIIKNRDYYGYSYVEKIIILKNEICENGVVKNVYQNND